jgi:hypothetical protein
MSNKKIKTCRGSISEEIQNKRKQLLQLFKDCPVPGNELFGVTAGYEHYLDNVLSLLEQEMPMNVIKKYELRKGNAVDEIKKYLEENPETIIALAYFDLDLYEPTKKCLEAIKGYLTRGSVLVFDELNYHDFPGETIALKEVFGLDRFSIKRTLHSHEQSYVIYDPPAGAILLT